MPTLGETVSQATQLLASTSDSARLDAELLIAQCLKLPRTRFISEPELALDAQQLDQVQASISRRAKGSVSHLLW